MVGLRNSTRFIDVEKVCDVWMSARAAPSVVVLVSVAAVVAVMTKAIMDGRGDGDGNDMVMFFATW